MNCRRCEEEAAEIARKRDGYARLLRAVNREGELDDVVRAITGLDLPTARAVIDAVRKWDEQTCLMREAHDDHQAQNNEDDSNAPY